ncbi:MAG: M48 family metalloprotease [Geminicoccaceae bacterium]|nr:M48 family metalloprotease [Geminicoccaceae bacterium]
MIRTRTALLAATLSVSLALTSACTTAPAGGGPILATGSVEDDVRAGREAHPQILAEYGGAVDDPELAAYVSRVGNRLKNVSELAEIDFTFTVLDSEVVNAFALPGGYVYVSRGLLAYADDEAELAGVLAHEIGHVTARHSASRQTTGQLATFGLGLLGVLGGAVLGGEEGARLGAQLGQQTGYGLTQTYSRSQEYEADTLGIRYLDRAGYDTRATADFLQALQTSAELQARLVGASVKEPGAFDHFFSSHPYTPDRVEEARDQADERGSSGDERNRAAFLAAIDGIVYGQSPAQGFVQGSRFAHPGLGIAFAYPEPYRLSNQPTAVVGRADNRLLLFDMGAARQATDPARYLQGEWLKGLELHGVERFTSDGGLEGAIGYADVQVGGQNAQAGFAVLSGGGREFYRFALITGRFGRNEARELRAAADSLHRLTKAEAAALRPLRVEIIEVREGDTIESLARRMEVERLPREQFITLNGFDRGRQLEAGDQVKIIVRG